MIFKFNGGNGAYLCDKCGKIVYTSSTVPNYIKRIDHKDLSKTPLLCNHCKAKNYNIKSYIHNGWYGEGEVYVMENLDDWDNVEKFYNETRPDWKKYNPSFYKIKEDFKKYIGKIWVDKNKLKYCLNDISYYEEYKIIAIEDDKANADWYWIVQNVDDERDIKTILTIGLELKEGIK